MIFFILEFIFKVNECLKRFGNIPDCLELDHLTVSGDVWFGKGVTLRVNYLQIVEIKFLNRVKILN